MESGFSQPTLPMPGSIYSPYAQGPPWGVVQANQEPNVLDKSTCGKLAQGDTEPAALQHSPETQGPTISHSPEPQAPTIANSPEPQVPATSQSDPMLSWARDTFPSAYQIFSQEEITFTEIDASKCQDKLATMIERSSKLLDVGRLERENHETLTVYAFVDLHHPVGDKHRRDVKYICVCPEKNIYKELYQKSKISLDAPFCDVTGDSMLTWATLKPILEALVHYCFLIKDQVYRSHRCTNASGTMREVDIYQGFCKQLKNACERIEEHTRDANEPRSMEMTNEPQTRNESLEKTESAQNLSAPTLDSSGRPIRSNKRRCYNEFLADEDEEDALHDMESEMSTHDNDPHTLCKRLKPNHLLEEMRRVYEDVSNGKQRIIELENDLQKAKDDMINTEYALKTMTETARKAEQVGNDEKKWREEERDGRLKAINEAKMEKEKRQQAEEKQLKAEEKQLKAEEEKEKAEKKQLKAEEEKEKEKSLRLTVEQLYLDASKSWGEYRKKIEDHQSA